MAQFQQSPMGQTRAVLSSLACRWMRSTMTAKVHPARILSRTHLIKVSLNRHAKNWLKQVHLMTSLFKNGDIKKVKMKSSRLSKSYQKANMMRVSINCLEIVLTTQAHRHKLSSCNSPLASKRAKLWKNHPLMNEIGYVINWLNKTSTGSLARPNLM